MTLSDLISKESLDAIKLQRIKMVKKERKTNWPDRHIHDEGTKPVPFHIAQNLVWDSDRRNLVMSAGSQSGKTSFGPHWLRREIYDKRGAGDYIAITATYDLFKLKMLPAMLDVFIRIYDVGRYWAGDRIIELRDPVSQEFWADKSSDSMWGRIILRSAEAIGGLESATAKGAWLDECGQDGFSVEAYRAIRRRVALKRGRMLFTTTLYSSGNWIVDVIDKSIKNGNHSLYKSGKGEIDLFDDEANDICCVQFDSIINPAFSVLEFEEQRSSLPEDVFNMFYKGKVSGKSKYLIYESFDIKNHTCRPFAIPGHWRKYAGVDFGSSHMCAMKYAENPIDGKLYCYQELLLGNMSIRDHVQAMILGEYGPIESYGGATSEDQWRTEFGMAGFPIMKPDVRDVDIGIVRVCAQHKQNGIMYFDTLTGILEQKRRYRYKRNSVGEATREIENKADFHYLDAERYLISTIRPGQKLGATVLNLGDFE